MINFKSIKYKNFLSSGNYFTEIPLNKDKSTLIVGHNGAGKSTMLDAISFALFGKPHRKIMKNQLVNSINQKQAVVEVEFSVGSAQFRILRGIKPNIFEIWKDGTMINQSSHSLEYQKILEQNILKLNHKSFHQVVVLGSSSFIPFMQLNAGHRRNVIEDLLDINIFSKMNLIIRERNSILKESITRISNDTNIVKSKIEQQAKYIRDIAALTQENKNKYETQVSTGRERIKVLQKQNSELSLALESSTAIDELKGLQTQKNKVIGEIATIKQEMKSVAKRGMFLEKNDECPTCDQPIANKDKLILETRNEAHKVQSSLSVVEQNGSSIDTDILALEELIKDIKEKTDTINANNREIISVTQNNDELQKYLESEVSADLTGARNDLETMNNDKESLFEEKLKLNEQFGYNNVIAEMLRDTGIKTKIIKQYLPIMNQLINKNLADMDFFVNFTLDDGFKETIKSRHRDVFNYHSFSEGEKLRIDLSILFTWREIAKMKNSMNTNLLILDEVFDSSLDASGTDEFMRILTNKLAKENVFVISHKGDTLIDKFPSILKFEKYKNFTRMA